LDGADEEEGDPLPDPGVFRPESLEAEELPEPGRLTLDDTDRERFVLPPPAPAQNSDFRPGTMALALLGIHGNYKYDTTGYYNPFNGSQFAYGPGRYQPYILGWYCRDEVSAMPASRTVGTPGSLQIIEWNSDVRYAYAFRPDLMFTWAGGWNSRWWSGPTAPQLPYGFDNLYSDFELAWHPTGRWSGLVGVTPQINSDFERSLNSNAIMVDGRAIGFYRASPNLMFAFGAAYWNRVRDRIVPYAGVIWSPADRWELRLLFPKSRISYFAGNYRGCDVWCYTSAEYNVEAYQADIQDTRVKDRIEMSDYRVLAGVNGQYRMIAPFLEGGWVFDRHVRFRESTPGFGIQDGFIVRLGARY